ncbi:YbaB/EbfC family nucleoid-associated protein [Actinomadura kijaniata]|uniref:YbaB/EbfC family nucleoid-associated protein n=1 Tax=Actinomadura kijaniata TaxID=46161 RepID=UPI00082C2861|nr:YbaB/EbfC family nucleoid-associated protein [Actinomadura kijaniata]
MTSLTPEELDNLAYENEKRAAKMQEVAESLTTLTGVGYAADQRIRATVRDGGVLSDLALDPRVMRMDSAGLAESIVEAVRAASADLQRQIEERMAEVTDQSPFALFQDLSQAQAKFDELRDGFQKSIDEIMGRVDRIRHDLDR